MNVMKPGRPKKPEDSVADPKILVQVITQLMDAETEFFIKVEGTSTLPYASCVQALDVNHGQFILKLVRPLPHEMMQGAQFRMLFAAGDQRYESLIEFIAREAYLQYRFDLPIELVYADRRGQKRYPFRPRENAYVTASDGGLPGLGVAGPLVNISLGGLAIRVDRVLKLDDGMRIPPSTSRFERGMFFPRLRIQDLPRLPILEVDGRVAHASEHGSEIILGIAFRELDEEQSRQLRDCIAFREKVLKTSTGPRPERPETAPGDSGSHTRGRSASELPAEDTPEPGAPETDTSPGSEDAQTPLRLLRRKAARLALFAGGSPMVQRLQDALWASGYHRLEVAPQLPEPSGEAPEPPPSADLVLMDLDLAQVGDAEPLAAVRHLEKKASTLGAGTLVILCDSVDPMMFLGQAEHTRFLALGAGDEAAWIHSLDSFLGLSDPSGE